MLLLLLLLVVVVLVLVVVLVAAILSWSGTPQGQAAAFLQQCQGGRVGPAGPGVVGGAALHLVHSLGHGGQRGRGWVGVQVGGGAEEGAVGGVGGGGNRRGEGGLPPQGTAASRRLERRRHGRLLLDLWRAAEDEVSVNRRRSQCVAVVS